MHAGVVLSSTDNLLSYSGKVVKVIPKLDSLRIQSKIKPRKGCGRVVREV